RCPSAAPAKVRRQGGRNWPLPEQQYRNRAESEHTWPANLILGRECLSAGLPERQVRRKPGCSARTEGRPLRGALEKSAPVRWREILRRVYLLYHKARPRRCFPWLLMKPAFRSEERRVGKECRSEWWPDHRKKN